MKQGKAAVAWLKNRVRIVDLRAKGPPRHARHGEGRPAARRHRRCRTPGGAVVPSAGRTEAGRSHGSRRNGGRTAITRLARMGWSVGRSCARVWQSSATLTPLRQPGTWLGGNAMRRSGQQMAPARKRTTGTPRPSTNDRRGRSPGLRVIASVWPSRCRPAPVTRIRQTLAAHSCGGSSGMAFGCTHPRTHRIPS